MYNSALKKNNNNPQRTFPTESRLETMFKIDCSKNSINFPKNHLAN